MQYAPAGLARNKMMPAISSMRPNRWAGIQLGLSGVSWAGSRVLTRSAASSVGYTVASQQGHVVHPEVRKEEMYVYPAIEEHVPDGPAHVAHDKQEHEEIVLIMKRLEDVDASDPAFIDQVRRLEAGLLHHASHEESEQFPHLRAHIPGERLVKIGE